MFGWLIGPNLPRNETRSVDNDATRDAPAEDAPDTPAPVFMARAFHNALLGPSIHISQENAEVLKEPQNVSKPGGNNRAVTGSLYRSAPSSNFLASPSKPSGILLTPGTATGKRKSVSFGGEGIEPTKDDGRSGLPSNYPGKFPSPWTKSVPEFSVSMSNLPTEDVFRDLVGPENQRTYKDAPVCSVERTKAFKKQLGMTDAKSTRSPVKKKKVPVSIEVEQKPVLSNTRNSSGMASADSWRTELEQHSQKTEQDFRRLESQTQMAKTYARKKDTEATDLGGRLRKEKQRVSELEAKVVQMAAVIANAQLNGDVELDVEAYSKLAQPVARVAKHRKRLEKLEAAVQDEQTSSESAQAVAPAQSEVRYRPKHSPKQASELAYLKAEIRQLREIEKGLKKNVQRMEDTKQQLSSEVTRCRKTMGKQEQRITKLARELEAQKQSHQDRTDKLKAKVQDLQEHKDEDCRERLATAKLESLLKRKDDEITELRHQLLSRSRRRRSAKSKVEIQLHKPIPSVVEKPTKLKPYLSEFAIAESDPEPIFEQSLLDHTVPTSGQEFDKSLKTGIWDNLDLLESSLRPELPRTDSSSSVSVKPDQLRRVDLSGSPPKSRRPPPSSSKALCSPITSSFPVLSSPLPTEDTSTQPMTPSPLRQSSSGRIQKSMSLPPDRMAAAKARIAERMAGKRRLRNIMDKENLFA